MDSLRVILTKMQEVLNELEGTLMEEVRQLSRAHINPVSLQVVSDNKSRLLSAINFYDEQRKQVEKESRLSAPYPFQPKLCAHWDAICHVVRHANELNQKSFQLLEVHMQKVNSFQRLVNEVAGESSLYGEGGSQSRGISGRHRISV